MRSTSPVHLTLIGFDETNNIWLREQIIKLSYSKN